MKNLRHSNQNHLKQRANDWIPQKCSMRQNGFVERHVLIVRNAKKKTFSLSNASQMLCSIHSSPAAHTSRSLTNLRRLFNF